MLFAMLEYLPFKEKKNRSVNSPVQQKEETAAPDSTCTSMEKVRRAKGSRVGTGEGLVMEVEKRLEYGKATWFYSSQGMRSAQTEKNAAAGRGDQEKEKEEPRK